ncbi:hypothetical protein ELH77_19135 [Rhizobium ruizarguesonis]|uniref:hypothetical protein n=1 Tax=Rhizobium ruizarguesonis TaxID=2081791 RepID=UPI001030363A|nr:hypothetical protein [Rhizobium ruizarguesonis]TAZ20721.1 hypothetical protein ELH77_19135 [Rhizobium ruizarguesonis]
MDIIQKILEQISFHRAEILRLESALQVISEVGGGKVAGKAKEAPMITIRRTVPAVAADDPPPVQKKKRASPTPSQKSRSRSLADNRQLRGLLLTALKTHGPALSRDVAVTIGFKPGEDIQPVYQRLYELKRDRLVEKGDEGHYSITAAGLEAIELVQEDDGAAAGASEQAA